MFFSGERDLQLVNKKGSKEAGNIVQIVFDANLDAAEFARLVKGSHGCRRITDNSGDVELAGEGFTNDIAHDERELSFAEPLLYRNELLVFLRGPIAMNASLTCS